MASFMYSDQSSNFPFLFQHGLKGGENGIPPEELSKAICLVREIFNNLPAHNQSHHENDDRIRVAYLRAESIISSAIRNAWQFVQDDYFRIFREADKDFNLEHNRLAEDLSFVGMDNVFSIILFSRYMDRVRPSDFETGRYASFFKVGREMCAEMKGFAEMSDHIYQKYIR